MNEPHYTVEACGHIASIHAYVEGDSPHAAQDVIMRIRRAAQFLTLFPRMGHHGMMSNTYELLVRGPPYVLVYEVDPRDKITVLAIFHCARER